MHGEFLREPRAELLSAGAACLRRFRQDTRRLPVQVTAPVLADSLPAVRPVAVASESAAGGDAVGAFRPAADIGWDELFRPGLQSPGDWQAPEPAPRRLPATVAAERRPLSVRVRALSGRVRRAAVRLAVAGGPVRARAGWAWCAEVGLLLLLTTLAAAPAHGQQTGICGRTSAVQTAILAKIANVDNCADATANHLAAITGTLDLYRTSINALAAGDFDGLTSLTILNLGANRLTTLPAGVFDGLTALTLLSLRLQDFRQ